LPLKTNSSACRRRFLQRFFYLPSAFPSSFIAPFPIPHDPKVRKSSLFFLFDNLSASQALPFALCTPVQLVDVLTLKLVQPLLALCLRLTPLPFLSSSYLILLYHVSTAAMHAPCRSPNPDRTFPTTHCGFIFMVEAHFAPRDSTLRRRIPPRSGFSSARLVDFSLCSVTYPRSTR